MADWDRERYEREGRYDRGWDRSWEVPTARPREDEGRYGRERDRGFEGGEWGGAGAPGPRPWSGPTMGGYAGGWSGGYDASDRDRYDVRGRDLYETRDRDRYEPGREGAGLWDRVKRGLHVGKGPKGYRRPDERIHEDVCDMLARDADVDATDIVVVVSEGEVTLEGTVEDRWTKRRAEDVVEGIAGVKDVHNRLKVASAPSSGLTAEMPATDRTSPTGRSTTTRNR